MGVWEYTHTPKHPHPHTFVNKGQGNAVCLALNSVQGGEYE